MDTKNITNQNGRYIHYMAAVVGSAILLLLDQYTKHLVLDRLKDHPPVILWKGVFQLEYLENRGAAFGLFQNQRVFFFASVIVITAVILWFYLRVPMERRFLPLRICAVFVMAGAWGNCIDFPIFNVADIYVTVAAFAVAILICFYYKEEDFERIMRR